MQLSLRRDIIEGLAHSPPIGTPLRDDRPTMRSFSCPVCQNTIHFENTLCTACGTTLGYEPKRGAFVRIGMEEGDHGYCANNAHGGCNWVVQAGESSPYCLSCDLNELIPPITDAEQSRRWAEVEAAKRRLVYSIVALEIPIYPKRHVPSGLSFRILVNAEHGGTGEVTMGHANGVITIDATEADAHLREFRRAELDERYRTLLGHMRHESGHYFWERLCLLGGFLEACREVFGDERADYGDALARHYDSGALADWNERFISAYATAHPWEDWAESFAHYLHIIDGVETAHSVGMIDAAEPPILSPHDTGSQDDTSFGATLASWHSVAMTMNAMNRSLGHQDYYPFVINPGVASKLDFIHRWMRQLAAA
jgi:hypothetical protein